MSYGDLPPSYWPLISKLKGKTQAEQDKLIEEFIQKQQDEAMNNPLSKFIVGEISENEFLAETHQDANERLKYKEKAIKERATRAFTKKA